MYKIANLRILFEVRKIRKLISMSLCLLRSEELRRPFRACQQLIQNMNLLFVCLGQTRCSYNLVYHAPPLPIVSVFPLIWTDDILGKENEYCLKLFRTSCMSDFWLFCSGFFSVLPFQQHRHLCLAPELTFQRHCINYI